MHLFWCLTDPTLYYDKKKQIIHAIVHNWQGGGHAASHDHGKSWRWYGGNCSAAKGPSSLDWSRSVWPPTFTVLGSDRIETPRRRERPHILVDKNYVVTALTTALQLGKSDATITLVQEVSMKHDDNSGDASFTVVQPIGGGVDGVNQALPLKTDDHDAGDAGVRPFHTIMSAWLPCGYPRPDLSA